MFANNGEQHLPETAHDKDSHIDGEEEDSAQRHHADPAGICRKAHPQRLCQTIVPVRLNHLRQLLCIIHMVQRRNSLQPNVIHPPEHGREDRKPDQNHHSLEVDGVANVRRAFRYQTRRVENGRCRFIQRVVLFELPFGKVRLNFFKEVF